MRFLLVGNGHLGPALRAVGHDVVDAFAAHGDLARAGEPFDARILWDRLRPVPDVLLVADTLGPQALPYGLEDIPVPRIYYAVDVHVNWFWQRHYASLFDLVLVAQKDYVPLLGCEGVPARWLPWGADDTAFRNLGMHRVHDVVFVGVVDEHRRKRAAALALLARRVPVTLLGSDAAARLGWDEMARVLNQARIVFNESFFGDVNFRVFEAMACGALLLTEDVGNGLMDLFTPDRDLVAYTPDTLVDATERLLADEPRRARIAAAGAALVHSQHTLTARMRTLAGWVADGIPRHPTGASAARDWGLAAHLATLRGLVVPEPTRRLAAECLHRAVQQGESAAALALAEMMVQAQRPTGALTLLAEARRLAPGEPRAWLVAAEIERRQGRADDGAALLRGGIRAAAQIAPATRASALAAIEDGIERAPCMHALGRVLLESGCTVRPGLACTDDPGWPRTAFDCFQRALELDPTHHPSARDAAALLEVVGASDVAVPFHEHTVAMRPRDREARIALLSALRRSYRHDEAMAEEAALLLDDAREHLAARDLAGARAALEQASHLGGLASGEVAEALAILRALR